MNLTWLFDLDDTLIANQHQYDHAKIALAEFLFEVIGYKAPDLQSIINLQTDKDVKLVKEAGFGMNRFPTSFQQTYDEICKQLGLPVNEEHRQITYQLGMLAFDEKRWKEQGLLEGAEETLQFLLGQEDELLLLTKGDQQVQERKIEIYQLNRFFNPENMHIVPQKNKEVIERVLGVRPKANSFSVGNSIRSDVEPSLAAGLKVIYIPCETWQYERDHQGIPEHPSIVKLDKVADIQDIYRFLKSTPLTF
jgi:putative hydrolase of the HAD superfamily